MAGAEGLAGVTEHSYFDPDGNPISLLEWGARFEDFGSRIFAEDDVGGDRDRPPAKQ